MRPFSIFCIVMGLVLLLLDLILVSITGVEFIDIIIFITIGLLFVLVYYLEKKKQKEEDKK